MTSQILTQKKLKELLHYNPDTGFFTWASKNVNKVCIGDIAGCKKAGYILEKTHVSMWQKSWFAGKPKQSAISKP